MNRLLTLLLLSLTFVQSVGQNYPIQVNTFLTPPFSPQLSNLGNPESNSLRVQLQLTDLSVPSIDVRLIMTIRGSGITIQTSPSYLPSSPITLTSGEVKTLMGSDLAQYLSADHLIFQGYSAAEYRRTGRIPEGFYEVSFQAVAYHRGVGISNPNPSIRGLGWFTQSEVPWIVSPSQGDSIVGKIPQNIVFQWQPRHIGTPGAAFITEYTLQLIEVWPSSRNPNDAFLSSPILFETTTQATSYAYSAVDPALEYGRKYAIRVQAKEYDPTSTSLSSSSNFQNNGYSEVISFTYVEDCQIPMNVYGEAKGHDLVQISWVPRYNHRSIDVRYEVVGGYNTYWEKGVTDNTVFLDKFQPEQVVKYQVRGNCEYNSSAFSIPQTLQTFKSTIHFTPEEAANSTQCEAGTAISPFVPTTYELLEQLGIGDTIVTTTENILVTKVSSSRGEGWFIGEGIQNISPWRLIGKGEFKLQLNANYEIMDGRFSIKGGKVAITESIPIDVVRGGLVYVREIVSNVDLSKKEGSEKEGRGFSLPPLDVANILSEGAEAAGEALTALPKAVASIPQETIDVMEGLTEEAEELIEEAKEIASSAPEEAEKLLAQANDKLGQVVNTLESLPEVMDSALDGLAALGEDSDYFLQLLKEALEEFNGIMGDTLKNKQRQQGANNQALAEQLAAIEASNLAVEDEQAPLTPLYDEPQLVEDESTFRESEARKQGFTLLRKKKSFFVFLAQLQNVFTYIETLLENEEQLKDLSEGFITKRRAEIFKLIQENKGLKGKEVELKLMMKDYMDSELVFLANEGKENEIEEFTDENLRTTAVATENHASLPTDKNYYISPLVPLSEEERDSVEMRLEAFLDEEEAKGNKLFVNVCYSQDLSRDSYLERAKSGRPKGLSQEYKYINLYWVNIPGSTYGDKHSEGDASQEQINEANNRLDNSRNEESQEKNLHDVISERLGILSTELDSKIFSITHCKACHDQSQQEATSSHKIERLDLAGAEDVLNLKLNLNQQAQLNLKAIDAIYSTSGICYALYYSADDEDNAVNIAEELMSIDGGTGSMQNESNLIFQDRLVLIDEENNKTYNCTYDLSQWDEQMCETISNTSSNLLNINLWTPTETYISDLFEQIYNCLERENTRIHNYSSENFVSETFLNSLFSGERTISETTIEGQVYRHTTKAHLFVTDANSLNTSLENEIRNYPIDDEEYKLWIHKGTDGNWEFKSAPAEDVVLFFKEIHDGIIADGLQDQVGFAPSFEGFFDALVEGNGLDYIATGLYEGFDWLAKGVRKARIPEYAWNCDKEGYKEGYAAVYKYTTGMMHTVVLAPLIAVAKEGPGKQCLQNMTDGKTDFAISVGMYNGLIEVFASVPELISWYYGIFSSKGREDFGNFIDNLQRFVKENEQGDTICSGAWCAIKTGLGESFDPTKCCQFAEQLGELTLPIIAACFGDEAALEGALSSSAKVLFRVIKIIKYIDNLGDPFNALKWSFRYVRSGVYKVRNAAKQVIIKVSNEAYKVRVLTSDGLREIERSLAEGFEIVTENGKTYVKNIDGAPTGRARVLGYEVSQALADKGLVLEKLHKLIKDLDDGTVASLLNRLDKTGLSGDDLNKFVKDLTDDAAFRSHFTNLDVVGDAVEKFKSAWKKASDIFPNGSKYITDVPALEKISNLAAEGSSFRNKLGSKWETALDDILKGANDLKCSTCGKKGRVGRSSIDQYLDDVDHFIKNFDVSKGGKGEVFYNWMTKATNPTSGQLDELHQTIRDFAKRGIKESDVVDIGKQFPIGTKKYDLQQIGGKFTEYKNKDFVSHPLTASSGDVDQFINGYLKNVDNLDDLEWKACLDKLTNKGWTDANALSKMKDQWKKVFESKADEIFDANPSLFNNYRLKDGTKITDSELFEEFIEEVTETHSIFNFVKVD